MQRPIESTPLPGMIRTRAVLLARWIFRAWLLLWIWGTGPETTHAMQAQERPGCVIVAHAESDTMRYAQSLGMSIVRATTGIDVSAIASTWLDRPLFSFRYESDGQMLHVRIEEIQENERNQAVYPIALTLEAGALGTTERFEVTLNERIEEFSLPFPYRPRFVAIQSEAHRFMEYRTSQPPRVGSPSCAMHPSRKHDSPLPRRYVLFHRILR